MVFKIEAASPCHNTKRTIVVDMSKKDADGIVAVEPSKEKCSWCGKEYDVPGYAIKLS